MFTQLISIHMKPFFLSFMILFSVIFNARAQKTVIHEYLRQLSASKEDTIKAGLLSQLSRRYLYYRPDSALFYANDALHLSEQLQYPHGIAQAYNDIAATMFYNGNHNRALELNLKALQIRERIKDSLGISASYVNIGIVYDEMGDYRQSIYYNKKAIEIDEALQDYEALSIDYLNLGEDYLTLNLLDSALHFTQTAYSLALKANGGIPVLPNALHNLGVIQKVLNKPDLALAHFREALNQAEFLNDSKQATEVCYEMALLYNEKNLADSMLEYALKSLNAATAFAYQQDIIHASGLLSTHFETAGKPDSALYYLKLNLAAKDSIYNQEKVRQVQTLTFNEQLRQQEIWEAKAEAARQRRNNLQYIGIGIFIITLFSLVLLMSKVKVKPRVVEFLGLLGLLLLFEFISVLLDPWIGHFTHHNPVFILGISAAIAALLVPVHHRLTSALKKRLAMFG